YFPEAQEAEPVQGDADEQIAPKGNETILVVEDDEAVRQVTVRSLQNLGYVVLSARDGLEAADIFELQHGEIDLVVVDMVMPHKSGLNVYQELLSIKPDLPAIFVTGYADKAELQTLISPDTPLVSILYKPFTGRILGKSVRELLDRKDMGTT
ncbi:MAG: response regulator, partial [bacterium]